MRDGLWGKKESKLKFTIIMAYYNRKAQLLLTLKSFEKLYGNRYNLEVIIVDDMSDKSEKITTIEKDFSFNIKLIELTNKTWSSPVIPYNIAINHISDDTDFIIIQNPEIFHCGNILKAVMYNTESNVYMTFPVFSSPTVVHNDEVAYLFEHNTESYYRDFIEKIDYSEFGFDYKYYLEKYPDVRTYNFSQAFDHFLTAGSKGNRVCNKYGVFFWPRTITKWKGWFNHHLHRPCNYHFLSAISKSLLDKVGGFCNEMKDGTWYDDDDFLHRIKKVAQVKTIDSKIHMGIHLYHNNSSSEIFKVKDAEILKQKNLQIFEKNKKGNVIYCDPYNGDKLEFKYPRIMHLYWDKSPLSFLNYLTVVSFNKFHTDWKIKVYTPKHRTTMISWKSGEQKLKYIGKCYFKELYNISNVEIIEVDIEKIGFNKNASEVIKSDYFRYHILYTQGGLWSDFDIIYTGNIEKKMNFIGENIIFRCSQINNNNYKYMPVGLLLSRPKNKFFKYIIDNCHIYYDKKNYQCLGVTMLNSLFLSNSYIYENFDSVVLDNTWYLPLQCDELASLFQNKSTILPKNTIGIHWFNGSNMAREYQNALSKRLEIYCKKITEVCLIDKYVNIYKDCVDVVI